MALRPHSCTPQHLPTTSHCSWDSPHAPFVDFSVATKARRRNAVRAEISVYILYIVLTLPHSSLELYILYIYTSYTSIHLIHYTSLYTPPLKTPSPGRDENPSPATDSSIEGRVVALVGVIAMSATMAWSTFRPQTTPRFPFAFDPSLGACLRVPLGCFLFCPLSRPTAHFDTS